VYSGVNAAALAIPRLGQAVISLFRTNNPT
jgi:hypothetical protein